MKLDIEIDIDILVDFILYFGKHFFVPSVSL